MVMSQAVLCNDEMTSIASQGNRSVASLSIRIGDTADRKKACLEHWYVPVSGIHRFHLKVASLSPPQCATPTDSPGSIDRIHN